MTVEQAAKALYAAEDRLKATVKGTDEYVEARMARASAQSEYDQAYARKLSGYTATIRKA